MKRKITLGILLFIVLSSFAFAQIGQGGTISLNIVTDTETPITNISQGGLTFNSSSYWNPTGKHVTGNIIFILGSLTSLLSDFNEPQFQNVSINPRLAYTNQEINISIDSYDDVGIVDEWSNVTFPDSSSILNSTPYPFSFVATQNGVYAIRFYAIDTSDNWGVSPFYLVNVFNPVTFSINITSEEDNASALLHYDYSHSNFVEFTNNFSITVPETVYSLTVRGLSNQLSIYYNQFNTTESSSLNLSYNKYTNYLGYNEVYYVGSNYSFPTQINISYTNIQNENFLSFYICNDWNISSQNCSIDWNETSAIRDAANDRATFSLASINMSTAFAISQESFCGDGTCNSNEGCENCPVDCGVCSSEGGSGTTTSGTATGGSVTTQPPVEAPDDESYYYDFISQDDGIDISIDDDETSIRRIRANLGGDVRDIRFEIKSLIESELLSYSIPGLNYQVPNAIVYDYVIISHENLEDEVLESEFTFEVSSWWYEQYELYDNETKIYKFIDGTWTEMEITNIEFIDNKRLVTIRAEGLSLFSIAGLKGERDIFISEPNISEDSLEEAREDYSFDWLSFSIMIIIISFILGVVVSRTFYTKKTNLANASELKKIETEMLSHINAGMHDFSQLKDQLSKKHNISDVDIAITNYNITKSKLIISKYGLDKPHTNYSSLLNTYRAIAMNEIVDLAILVEEMKKIGWSEILLNHLMSHYYEPITLFDEIPDVPENEDEYFGFS